MREHLARVEGDIDNVLSPQPAPGPDPVRMGGRHG
jgi:hypothetical protein